MYANSLMKKARCQTRVNVTPTASKAGPITIGISNSLAGRTRYTQIRGEDKAKAKGTLSRTARWMQQRQTCTLASPTQTSSTQTPLASAAEALMLPFVQFWAVLRDVEKYKAFFLTIAAKIQLWKLPYLPVFRNINHLVKLVQVLSFLGIVSSKTVQTFAGLCQNYTKAVVGKSEGVDEKFAFEVMRDILIRVFKEFLDPFEFDSYHQRLLKPYNYYDFGQRYVRCMVDFNNSYIGHLERFKEVEQKIKRGENVILLANHQSEADPGVFALLLEKHFPSLAENIIYVAGDRVVTDPLAKPFSMGRNLFTVHSKKYMDEDPKTKSSKMRQNRTTLVKMQRMLNEGGNLVWIAPSGGRDRPNEENRWVPSPFDEATIELMKKFATSSKSKTALYPFAMWSWKIMPPPVRLQVELGEERIINFSGVGVALAEELNLEEILQDLAPEDEKNTLTKYTWDAMNIEYRKLDKAIREGLGKEVDIKDYCVA